MKKCPKCGADNKPDSSACYNCFSSLTDIQPTATPGPLNSQPLTGPEITQPMQTAQPVTPQPPIPLTGSGGFTPRSTGPLTGPPQSENQQTVVGQPLGGYQQQTPSPYGQQPGPYGHPQQPYHRRGEFARPEPVKSSGAGTMIAVIVLILAVIGGGIFAYMNYFKPEDNTPVGVVRAFIKASDAGNKEAMKKHMTKGSQDKMVPGAFDFDQMADNGSGSFGKQPLILKEGSDYTLRATTNGDTRAVVSIMIQPTGYDKIAAEMSKKANIPAQAQQIAMDIIKRTFQSGVPIVAVIEDGKWKVDGAQTQQAMQELLQKAINEAMHMAPRISR